MEYGMKVKIIDITGAKRLYRNVTEVHYLYKNILGKRDSVAIESDLHNTGGTVKVDVIVDMEITPETEIQDDYYGGRM